MHAVHEHCAGAVSLSVVRDEGRTSTFLSGAAFLHHRHVGPSVGLGIGAIVVDPQRTDCEGLEESAGSGIDLSWLSGSASLSTITKTGALDAAGLDDRSVPGT